MNTYIPPSRRGSCTSCGKTIQLSKTSAAEPHCLDCRRAGRAPSRAVHGTTRRWRTGCRCSPCCEAKARENRDYVVRNGYRVVARPCDQCGAEFEARKDCPTRFCSQACVAASQRKWDDRGSRRNARRRAARRRQRFERLIAEAAAGTSGGNRVWVQGDCLVCSEPFLSPGLASRYCSRECRAEARSSRSWISFEDRRAIYVRDGWVCQICGEGTSRRFTAGDPWSPTLDHIVPRSRGGSDDAQNLRLAHSWCNSVRGDLSFYTDDDLQLV